MSAPPEAHALPGEVAAAAQAAHNDVCSICEAQAEALQLPDQDQGGHDAGTPAAEAHAGHPHIGRLCERAQRPVMRARGPAVLCVHDSCTQAWPRAMLLACMRAQSSSRLHTCKVWSGLWLGTWAQQGPVQARRRGLQDFIVVRVYPALSAACIQSIMQASNQSA